jgi:hypothetical protein
MLKHLVAALGLANATLAFPSHAASFSFDVLYSGSGNASLVWGSDNPVGTSMFDGDSFVWHISAAGDGYWDVQTGGNFFPLMAFGVQESGARTGEFTLTLRNDGIEVFSLSETAALNNYVHLGTNTINLPTGLMFDEMRLDYALTTALESPEYTSDPDKLQPIASTPTGLLPIFGAPELNPFYPGIIYGPVPEPATWAAMLAGLALMGATLRQRRSR